MLKGPVKCEQKLPPQKRKYYEASFNLNGTVKCVSVTEPGYVSFEYSKQSWHKAGRQTINKQQKRATNQLPKGITADDIEYNRTSFNPDDLPLSYSVPY
jgi:hypothetical protein